MQPWQMKMPFQIVGIVAIGKFGTEEGVCKAFKPNSSNGREPWQLLDDSIFTGRRKSRVSHIYSLF